MSLSSFSHEYHTNERLEWSNSRKPFGKYDRCSVCANNVVTRSLRQTNRKRGSCKHMIPHSSEEDMEKWRVRENSVGIVATDGPSLVGVWSGAWHCTEGKIMYDCALDAIMSLV